MLQETKKIGGLELRKCFMDVGLAYGTTSKASRHG